MLLWHFLAFVLIVVAPIGSAITGKRLKESTNPNKRVGFYIRAVAGFSALSILAWLAVGQDIFTSPFQPADTFAREMGYGLALYTAIMFCVPLALVKRKPAYKARFQKAMLKIEHILPRGNLERGLFALVSLSAGVNEEILFRGFLPRYFAGPLHLPVLLGAAVSIAVFGLCHLYQGRLAILSTSIIGAVMTILVSMTGWLIPAMVVHAIIDLRVLLLPPLEPSTTTQAT